MKSIKIASMLILIVFSLSMIHVAFAADIINKQYPIEEHQLNVKVNEEFSIGLSSNPSTGYTWTQESNSQFLKLVNERYIPNEPVLCGSGGKNIFTFKALQTGETKIAMKYLRPWENRIPEKEIVYQVKITE